MNNRVFVTADTHFGHKKIIEFEPTLRPFATIEQHDEELVRRWNDTVRPKDTVWHLGDVVFGAINLPILGRLNGLKHLIMGNHDHYPAEDYLRYFRHLHGTVENRGYIMSHVPVHPQQLTRFKGNIHGHMHAKTMEDPRYACVSMEHTGLTPILLDTVIHRLENLK